MFLRGGNLYAELYRVALCSLNMILLGGNLYGKLYRVVLWVIHYIDLYTYFVEISMASCTDLLRLSLILASTGSML